MKKLLLTGGTGDIGLAIKSEFELHGYIVIAPTRIQLDLESPERISKFFEHNNEDFDCFVHCAGMNNPICIDELSLDTLNRTMQVNTLSCVQIIKNLIPSLKKNQGKIVAISSLYGSIAREGRSAYVMSKHALNGFIKTLALELGQYSIIANTVSPGFVDTKMTSKNNSVEKIKEFESKIPLSKLANTSDIAKAVYFLCSDENSYITGQDIIVDGGFIVGGYQG